MVWLEPAIWDDFDSTSVDDVDGIGRYPPGDRYRNWWIAFVSSGWKASLLSTATTPSTEPTRRVTRSARLLVSSCPASVTTPSLTSTSIALLSIHISFSNKSTQISRR